MDPTAVSPPPARPAEFEDFRVGHRLTVGSGDGRARHRGDGDGEQRPRSVTAGVERFMSLVEDGGILQRSVIRVLGTEWREVTPMAVGSEVHATFTVTRCRRLPGEAAGSVRWHAVVTDDKGRAVEEGVVTVLVAARSEGQAGDDAEPGFCTRPWGQAVAERLGEDPRFAAATATWDGSIGLRAGSDSVQLRVYRGRIVDVAARTPHGATFTVEAADQTWTELLTGPYNDFFRRVMSGDSFTVTGSAYEYLRMTKALVLLIDAARDVTTGAQA